MGSGFVEFVGVGGIGEETLMFVATPCVKGVKIRRMRILGGFSV